MKIAICDDDINTHKALSEQINEYAQLHNEEKDLEISCFISGEELLESSTEYRLILMDYQLPGINGIETCKKLRSRGIKSLIIFLSAYTEAAVESYDVEAFRFLVKPIQKEKLFKAFDACREELKTKSMLVKTSTGVWKIDLNDILYAEADGKKTIIRCKTTCYETGINLLKLEKLLPQEQFIRCHRSYVVNFMHIINYTENQVTFDNGEKASIGSKYAKDFKTAFQNFVMNLT